jgi:hypothetical protein
MKIITIIGLMMEDLVGIHGVQKMRKLPSFQKWGSLKIGGLGLFVHQIG